MRNQKGYLIIDIGTGNVRVALTDESGNILHLEHDNVRYTKDNLYPDALSFDPNELWAQISAMTKKAIDAQPTVVINAVTASSQREGIVLIDRDGRSLIGLSNHDNRGREWEDVIEDKHRVYRLTGRYPSALFSAFKVVGIRHRRTEIYNRFACMMSISDWAQFQVSGVECYEHSQASETLLYDVERGEWSAELCDLFDIDPTVLPPLYKSGTILGKVLPAYAKEFDISPDALVVVGGADTQLAVKSTQPLVDDIVIVSGTTTPIVKIVKYYITDTQERTWTNRHIDAGSFILEANAGVTGLNYQRLKEIFYPNEGYDVIERELAANPRSQCVASLGSLVADEKAPSSIGGFVFSTPVSHELTRSSFVRATLWDIACSIKENLQILCQVSGHSSEFVWACGGGFQSPLLRQAIANLTGKKVRLRSGYQQASVVGGALVCNEALGIKINSESTIEEALPQLLKSESSLYEEWKEVRQNFRLKEVEETV